MQEQALRNIFKQEELESRTVKITRKISDKQYNSADVFGRSWPVDSNDILKIGQFVTIQGRVKIGSAGPFSNPTNYEV